jgi:hypothetical protein
LWFNAAVTWPCLVWIEFSLERWLKTQLPLAEGHALARWPCALPAKAWIAKRIAESTAKLKRASFFADSG